MGTAPCAVPGPCGPRPCPRRPGRPPRPSGRHLIGEVAPPALGVGEAYAEPDDVARPAVADRDAERRAGAPPGVGDDGEAAADRLPGPGRRPQAEDAGVESVDGTTGTCSHARNARVAVDRRPRTESARGCF